jgi:hypothetical protein
MDTQVLITATLKWQHSLIVCEIDNIKLDPTKASISRRFTIGNVWSSIDKYLVLWWTMIYIITFTVIFDRMRSKVARQCFGKIDRGFQQHDEMTNTMARKNNRLNYQKIHTWMYKICQPSCLYIYITKQMSITF